MTDLHTALGAPGDFGYDTEFGKALFALYELHAEHTPGKSAFQPAAISDGRKDIEGNTYMGAGSRLRRSKRSTCLRTKPCARSSAMRCCCEDRLRQRGGAPLHRPHRRPAQRREA